MAEPSGRTVRVWAGSPVVQVGLMNGRVFFRGGAVPAVGAAVVLLIAGARCDAV